MNLPKLSFAAALVISAACAPATPPMSSPTPQPAATDPRVGLRAGLLNAEEAVSNLRVMAKVPPAQGFVGSTNSDLAFLGNYAIQGNYNGWQIWDISNPSAPVLTTAYVCPASQSDVSVYKNLLFVSGEGLGGRLDCGTQPVRDTVSAERLRGLRIFDISDIRNPRNVGNVQTCRGSHTHTVLVPPSDPNNVYVYISGSAGVRSPNELPGCVRSASDPNTSQFRIEVIRVPLANPGAAAIVSSPRIFENLVAPPRHGPALEDTLGSGARMAAAKARGEYTYMFRGQENVLPPQFSRTLLDSLVRVRGGTGAPTAADSAKLRTDVQGFVDRLFAAQAGGAGGRTGPTQCHDITVYPELGVAGGACEGYGFLLDIRDPVNPVRIDAVADSNFSYWHSATFNNDGTKILFSDEWGGGGGPKCRATDPKEWGANAIFTIEPGRKMEFRSYYKLPAVQTSFENCVAHNGSMIPIPGRDVMVQAWYQGGISVFDWTDPANPFEMAYHDRGPSDSTRMGPGGSWSAYWYNGAIVSSEISRGLDVFEMTPSEFVTQNEIDAARTVHLDYFNAQGQPKFNWPPTFALARAFTDQLERNRCLSSARIASVRQGLSGAERAAPAARRDALLGMASQLRGEASRSCDQSRVGKLAQAAQDLAGIQP
ncbi:MAG: hypothetical protein WD801_11095 [Gemmatimonadaceae bacterium]